MSILEVIIENSDLSSKELALQLSCSTQQLNDWKKGRRPIPEKYIPELCKILNVEEEIFNVKKDEVIVNYYKNIIESEIGKKIEIRIVE